MPIALVVPEPVLASTAFPFRTMVLPDWPVGTEALYENVQRTVEAIELVSRRGGACSDATVDAWARNPDERVTVALLSAKEIALSRPAVDLITVRAFRMARAEKAILTPVVDALLARYWTNVELAPYNANLNDQAKQSLSRRCLALVAWLHSHVDCLAVLPLFAFSSWPIHDAIIRHARRVPVEWIAFAAVLHPELLLVRWAEPGQCPVTARNLLSLILGRATECSDDAFIEILGSIEEFSFNRDFSVTDCARVEALLGARARRGGSFKLAMGDLLRETMAEHLTRVPRTLEVKASDLTHLLTSTCAALRLAALDLAGGLVHQPI